MDETVLSLFGSLFCPGWRESEAQLTEKQVVLLMHDTYNEPFKKNLKKRDEERERNIMKRMKPSKEKYDFINKALLESVAQITEMTKSDHPTAAARVKLADKMVMLLPLFGGSKLEVPSSIMRGSTSI